MSDGGHKLVRDAFHASATDTRERSLKDIRSAKKDALRRPRVVYKSGRESLEELLRNPNESISDWLKRVNHFTPVPVYRRSIRKMAWLVYGKPPTLETWLGERPPTTRAVERQVDPASEVWSTWVQDMLDLNRNGHLNVKGMRARLRETVAPLKVWGVNANGEIDAPPFKAVRMAFMPPENVERIADPDDERLTLAVVETRGDRNILTTTESVMFVKDDLSLDGEAGAHPIPGTIPWAFLGDGSDLFAALIEYERNLINLKSTNNAVHRSQAFPIGEMKGNPTNPEVQAGAGIHGINVSGSRYLHFPDPAGGFRWVSVEANFAELRANYDAEKSEAENLGGGMPNSGSTSGTAPEQPTTVALRWLDAWVDRDQIILEAKEFEDQKMEILAAFAANSDNEFTAMMGTGAQGVSVPDKDAVDWNVTFIENPLPHDKREDRKVELQEVSEGVRLKADIVQRIYPEATEQELGDILEALAEQTKISFPSFPTEAPEIEDEEDTE